MEGGDLPLSPPLNLPQPILSLSRSPHSALMFSHEKLFAYQRAISFVAWSQPVIESLPSKVSARDQLDRSSTSVPLNIAEGNGKFSNADRARFWQIAHGSAVESAACLDVL